jgi:hypothetical protein
MNENIDWGRIGTTAFNVLTGVFIAATVFLVAISHASQTKAVESCSARHLVAVQAAGYGWVCVSFEKAVRP